MAWISKARRQAIYIRDNYTCPYCNQRRKVSELTLDHVIPRTKWHGKGSVNRSRNLVTCCHTCNSMKGDRNHREFAEYLMLEGYRRNFNAMILRVDRYRKRGIKRILNRIKKAA